MELHKEIKKNFPRIEKFFTEQTLSEFSNTMPKDLEQYNYGIGTMIRLKCLRPKSILYRKFIENGYTNRDEMAMEIIREFYKHINQTLR